LRRTLRPRPNSCWPFCEDTGLPIRTPATSRRDGSRAGHWGG
jgi:hypothetical protein